MGYFPRMQLVERAEGAPSAAEFTTHTPRTRLFALAAAPFALGLGLSLAACAKPEPPKIKPLDAKVKSVGLTGVDIDLTLEATNPNGVELSARKVKAHVFVNGNIDLGEVIIPTKTTIPANKTIKLDVPVSVEWKNVAAVGLAAATAQTMPFKIEGTAEIGFDAINFDVPFETSGNITREQLAEVIPKSMPQLPIPLPIPKLK